MYRWNGPAQRGAMKTRREVKRAEAEARNEAAQPVVSMECGHWHGRGRGCAA